MTIYSFAILASIVGFSVLGDYNIKIASGQTNGVTSLRFALGAMMYGLPAIGWLYLMRAHSLVAIGVFYSATTLLLMAALGFFVFKESFGLRDGIGVSLAILSMVVMTYQR